MAINVPFDAVEIAAAAEARAGWWGTVLDFARRRPLGAAGALVVVFLIVLFDYPSEGTGVEGGVLGTGALASDRGEGAGGEEVGGGKTTDGTGETGEPTLELLIRL